MNISDFFDVKDDISGYEKLFYTVVKTAFNQRRKTMRNSLKTLNLSDSLREDAIFAMRPEQLSVAQFVELTQRIENDGV